MQDRDIKFATNTIMWNEIAIQISKGETDFKQVLSLVEYMNLEVFDEQEFPIYDYAYIGRSIVKLQGLGVIQTDFIPRFGTTSTNDIDRIHITLAGQKVLKYL